MSTLLIIGGAILLLSALASLVRQQLAWRSLTEGEQQEQKAIKSADLELHKARRTHRGAVRRAEKNVARASSSPRRGQFARLELYDDRIVLKGQRYELSKKTRVKVHKRGRGDKRRITILLEDPTWPRSLDVYKTGKEHELDA